MLGGALTLWALPLAAPGVVVLGALAAALVAKPSAALAVFTWALPFHIVAMAALFGSLGLPAALVRSIAAWKEVLVALLLVAVMVRTLSGRGADSGITWLDWLVGAFWFVSLAYLLGAAPWLRSDRPVSAQAYGFRDAVFFTLLYSVGRTTPDVADDETSLRRFYLVGVVTSIIAVFELLLVPPQALVALGASSYFQDFLGVGAFTASNQFGLPDNYWTMIGGQLIRRAGSTYLSSQGFAIPFLIIVPAATLWILNCAHRRRALTWLGYALIWTGLLLTVTRMTIAACALETILIIVLLRRWHAAVSFGAIAVSVVVVALLAVPGLAGFVWDTITWRTSSSATHLQDWTRGLGAAIAHPLGSGLGATDQTAVRFGLAALTADNQYLKYMVELGVLGLVLHLATLLGVATAGLRVFRKASVSTGRNYGGLVFATTLGIAVNAMTAVVFNSIMLSYTYFWVAGTVVSHSLRLRAEPLAPRPA
jgi:hypothetical protein